MHNGYILEKEYFETIPFNFESGLPIIEAEIQGEKYHFLFDTGAPNVLSKELAEKIEYEVKTRNKINDSQGNSNVQESVLIDAIKIGDIEFLKMGAIIIDYNKVFEMTCFKFDGIIGANLMSKAAWAIDYETSEISFTEKVENFAVPDSAFHLDFVPKVNQRTPTINVKLNDKVIERVTFDTGATGHLELRGKAYGDLAKHETATLKGATSTGVYGRNSAKTETTFAVIDSLKIGGLEFQDQIVEFENSGAMIIGNKFFKNFKIILDWNKNDIFLIENSKYEFSTLEGFGFSPKFSENRFVVSSVFDGSLASEFGIKINDQITQINGIDYTMVSEEAGCKMLIEKPFKDLDTLNISILRGEETFEYKIPSEVLLNSQN